MVDVSLIFPVYNVANYLDRSIQSALNQTWKNIEIILVDDGSTDKSGEICDSYVQKDPRVRVIHKKSEGTGYARNTGLEAAEGEYVYFFDPDDWIETNLIEENLLIARKEEADIVMFGFKTTWENPDGSIKYSSRDGLPPLDGAYDYQAFWDNFDKAYNHISNIYIMLLRRKFLVDNNLYYKKLSTGEDVYFTYSIYATHFHRIVYNRKYYYYYTCREGSAMHKYMPARTEDTYQGSTKFDEVISNTPEAKGRYRDIVVKRYSSGLCMSLDNLSRGRKIVSLKDRVNQIKTVAERENVRRALNELESLSGGKKNLSIKERLLVHRHYLAAVLFNDLLTRIRKS